jgi:RNA polymerase sigma factor (sigma-70 family)
MTAADSSFPSQHPPTQFYIECWQAGDQQALGTLWERFTPLLHHRIRKHEAWPALERQMGVEDIAQEVWIRVLKGANDELSWSGKGAFVSWLARVTDTAILDLSRRSLATKRGGGSQPERLESGPLLHATKLPGATRTQGPASSARVLEFENLTREVLNEREQKAWTWTAVLGFTTEEAAYGLSTTPAAVRSLLRRSRQRLMDVLKSSGATLFRSAKEGG